MTYVELHCHSAYSFLDGASQPEELAARAAELGYEALALTDHDGVYGSLEFAHAAKAFGVRADHRRGGRPRRRLPRHAARRDAEGLREPLPPPDRGARGHAAEAGDEPLPPGVDAPVAPGAERRARLPLRLRAARARRLQPERGRPGRAGRFGATASSSSSSARTSAATPAGSRGCEELARDLGVADGRDRRRPRPPRAPRRAPGRARRDPLPHLARRLRARAARQPRIGAAPAGRRCSTASPTTATPSSARRDRRRSHVRPDAGARLPLPGLLRRVRDARRPAREPSVSGRSRIATRLFAQSQARGSGCDEELALISELKLSGFFLLHWEVLELAREVAVEVRGRGSPRHALPPGRGRGSSVGSIVCYLTGLSHVDPVERRPLARPLPEPRARLGARHRPRLPARHPREADRRASPSATATSTRPRRRVLDLPLARRDPRPRQGARPAVRRARAARPRHRGEPASRRRGGRAPPRRPRLGALARARRARARDRRPAAAHLAAPGRDGDLVQRRSSSSSPSSRRRWRAGRSASGTRTPAPTPAS